jgi:hypothetical protein
VLQLVDLKRSPEEVLGRLPPEPAAGAGDGHRDGGHGRDGRPSDGHREDSSRDGGYRSDVAWLLERLSAGEPVRIRCGGGEYREPGGTLWGKDRFARGGRAAMPWGGDVRGTDADPLYQKERYFPLEEAGELSAYAIPLPPGSYRVHLHFSEVYRNIPDVRRFDVLLGGRKVIEDFDPMEGGFATAIEKVFDAEVRHGLLEIRFVHRPPRDPPKVSAIEVERVE